MAINSFILFLICIKFSTVQTKTNVLNLDRQKIFKKTFHLETSHFVKVEDDGSTDLKIYPDFENAVIRADIFSASEIQSDTVCKLVYNKVVTPSDSTVGHVCKWHDLKLKPGEWYQFKVLTEGTKQYSEKRLANSWQAVEPAFDADHLDIAINPNETSLEIQINMDATELAKIWKPLIGNDGAIIVTLMDNENLKITKSITAAAINEVPHPKVVFNELSPGQCYTVEVYTAVDKIASYNRTRFYLRTKPQAISLTLGHVTTDTAVITVKQSNDGGYDQAATDKACSVLLTVENEYEQDSREDDPLPLYQYLKNQTSITLIDLLPDNSYLITGSQRCGYKYDQCGDSTSSTFQLSIKTLQTD